MWEGGGNKGVHWNIWLDKGGFASFVDGEDIVELAGVDDMRMFCRVAGGVGRTM